MVFCRMPFFLCRLKNHRQYFKSFRYSAHKWKNYFPPTAETVTLFQYLCPWQIADSLRIPVTWYHHHITMYCLEQTGRACPDIAVKHGDLSFIFPVDSPFCLKANEARGIMGRVTYLCPEHCIRWQQIDCICLMLFLLPRLLPRLYKPNWKNGVQLPVNSQTCHRSLCKQNKWHRACSQMAPARGQGWTLWNEVWPGWRIS
jgi:hypothetical protein